MTSLWFSLLFLLLFVAVAARVARTTVFEYERGLKFTRGRFKGVIGPGLYWHWAGFTQIQKMDVRPSRVAIAGQEVLSADGVQSRRASSRPFK